MLRRAAVATLLSLAVLGGLVLPAGTATATAPGTLTTFLDCVGTDAANGNLIAFFGYSNTQDAPVTIQVGPMNEVVGGAGIDVGQPSTFLVGTFPRVFSVEFTSAFTALVVWQLNGSIAQAYAGSPACQIAVTNPASDVQTAAATLNGTVVPGALDTTYWFEYGTTAAYGSSTVATSAGAGTTPLSVQASITGLTPATEYFFRIDATNATGTTYGAGRSFTTPAPAQPAVTVAVTSPASDVQSAGATLNGFVVPGGFDTTYAFEYGTTPGYGSSTPIGAAAAGTAPLLAQAVVTGLAPATTYYVRIAATNAGGTTYGGQQTFTTLTPLVVTTNELQRARLFRFYSVTLDVTGGAAPYTWAIVGGSLPQGLALDPATGTIRGVPTQRGLATFTVQVTGKGIGTRTLTLRVG